MVDMYAWGAYAERCKGSSPFLGTIWNKKLSFERMGVIFCQTNSFPYTAFMQPIQVKICGWRSCSERHSEYIKKRLEADTEFYKYTPDEVTIESCLCQWRCKEGPTVVYGNEVQIYQNPVKSSEFLRKKITEIRKRIHHKK